MLKVSYLKQMFCLTFHEEHTSMKNFCVLKTQLKKLLLMMRITFKYLNFNIPFYIPLISY